MTISPCIATNFCLRVPQQTTEGGRAYVRLTGNSADAIFATVRANSAYACDCHWVRESSIAHQERRGNATPPERSRRPLWTSCFDRRRHPRIQHHPTGSLPSFWHATRLWLRLRHIPNTVGEHDQP